MPPGEPVTAERQRRQKWTLSALAILLIALGFLVLFVLDRMPLPLRMLVGLGDLFAGLVLLVLVKQKFPQKPTN